MKYTCGECEKTFERKTLFKNEEAILCRGCKRMKFYEANPEKFKSCMEAKRKTYIDKYGVDNPSKANSIKQKLSEKISEAYARDKEGILNKKKQTTLKKYGVNHTSQNKEVQILQRKTCLHRYGYQGWEDKSLRESAQQLAHSDKAEQQRKETCQKKYGVDHHFQSKAIKDKQWKSYKEKTGFNHPAQNPNTISAYNDRGYHYNDIHFDSSWELAYYIHLTDTNRQFIYHPPYYIDYVDDGVDRKYRPDFLVEGSFIEIKGDNFFDELDRPYNCYSKTFWWNKYNAMKEHKVTILRLKEIKQYLRYVKDTYGKDYLKSFRNKVQRPS